GQPSAGGAGQAAAAPGGGGERPPACVMREERPGYYDGSLVRKVRAQSAAACRQACCEAAACYVWTFRVEQQQCLLRDDDELSFHNSSDAVSAVKVVVSTDVATCSLRACRFHDAQSPRLFVKEHSDGVGHRMINVFDGLALAAKHGLNFGGIVTVKKKKELVSHGHSFHDVLEQYFGSDVAGQLLFRHEPIWDAVFSGGSAELEAHLPFRSMANVFVPSCHAKVGEYTVALLTALAEPLMSLPLEYEAGRPSVAVHLRREDVRWGPRYTPDSYYYRVLGDVRTVLPSADVHVWTKLKMNQNASVPVVLPRHIRHHARGSRGWRTSRGTVTEG
ncbi:unnamed protein product, partial [Prorocentrum cordatum]